MDGWMDKNMTPLAIMHHTKLPLELSCILPDYKMALPIC